MSQQRDLVLLRHAQAEGYASTGADIDRVLTVAGRGQPAGVSEALLTAGFKPQLILCSGSARTRETLSLLQQSEICDAAEIRFSDALYECSARQILMELAVVETSIERLLLIGHNPGLSDLSTALSGHMVGLEPADFAWLQFFDREWSDIDAQLSRLINV